jgi:hypothetical protein
MKIVQGRRRECRQQEEKKRLELRRDSGVLNIQPAHRYLSIDGNERLFLPCPHNNATPDRVKKIYDLNKVANVGIEPKTFALLARRSNQLS